MPLWMWCLYILDFPGQPWVVNILSCFSHKHNHNCQAMCREFGFAKYGRCIYIRTCFFGLMPYPIALSCPPPSHFPFSSKPSAPFHGLMLFDQQSPTDTWVPTARSRRSWDFRYVYLSLQQSKPKPLEWNFFSSPESNYRPSHLTVHHPTSTPVHSHSQHKTRPRAASIRSREERPGFQPTGFFPS